MSVESDKFRDTLRALRFGPHSCDGKTSYPIILAPHMVDAILDSELLPGITLRRVVELKDKLRVLDDDQSLPPALYQGGDAFTEEAVKNDMVTAGFRRVSRLGEKEG